MLLGTYILTLLYAWFGKEKKYFWLWCTLVLVLLVNTSTSYADYDNYQKYFYRVTTAEMGANYAGMPIGWYYLCIFIGGIGLSYRGMVVIIIIISMFLIHISIKNFDGNKNIFYGIFLVFPGLIQCVQLRFFLGTSIVFLGLVALLKKDRRGLFKFLLAITIASLIHTSCVIFIFFVFLIFFDYFKTRKAIFLSISAAALIFFLSNYFLDFIQLITPSEKFNRYFVFSFSQTTVSWLLQILLVYCTILISSYELLKTNKKMLTSNLKLNNYYNDITDRMIKAIALVCITIPFLKFDRNFHRFIELAYMLCYILFIRFWKYKKIDLNSRFIIMMIAMSVIGVVTYIYTPFETVISPFFTFDGFHSLLR